MCLHALSDCMISSTHTLSTNAAVCLIGVWPATAQIPVEAKPTDCSLSDQILRLREDVRYTENTLFLLIIKESMSVHCKN